MCHESRLRDQAIGRYRRAYCQGCCQGGGPSLIDRVREVLAICSRACAAAHFYEEHKPMSDAALAEKGLARADLPRATFEKLTEER